MIFGSKVRNHFGIDSLGAQRSFLIDLVLFLRPATLPAEVLLLIGLFFAWLLSIAHALFNVRKLTAAVRSPRNGLPWMDFPGDDNPENMSEFGAKEERCRDYL